jgi:hypothetical protein
MWKVLLPVVAVAVCATAAHASSDDAWSEFAREVEQKCLAAAKGMIEAPKAVVDPFGSERFGLAVVTGKAKGAKARISHICVMDKKTKAVELGTELTADKVTVAGGR